jgi:hypothetical protein
LAGDGGVGFFFLFALRWGEGRGEVVEPRVEAVTDRFCDNDGEQWALPVLGDVCADVASAYVFGVEEATGNVPVLSDAVSVVVSVVVGGASDSVSVRLIDSISASGGVAVGASSSMASVVAFHW